MKFKDVLWKNALGEYTLYHTKSAYMVMLDEDSVDILWGMCPKKEDELSQKEQDYYKKLAEQGIMEPGIGSIPEERSQSPLVQLNIEVSSICNLVCKHCFIDKQGSLMDIGLYRDIIKQAKDLGVISITINGGEPLLHPDIIEMITLATSIPFRTELFTNATLITPEFCEQIADLAIDKVLVSLDGFEDNHDKVRGKGNYQKTLRGIECLKENNLRVWINSILHKHNEDDFQKFQKFCLKDLKVNGLKFTIIDPLGNAAKNSEMFLYPENTNDILSDLPDTVHPLRRSDMLRCRAGGTFLHISSDGKVSPCGYFEQASLYLGSLKEETLSNIYRTHLKKDSMFTNFQRDKLKDCKGCKYFKTCDGGCRARALLFTKNLYGKDPMACIARDLIKNMYE